MCSLSFSASFFFERGYRLLIEGLDPELTTEKAEEVIRSAPSALEDLYQNFSETAGAFGQVLLAYAYHRLGQDNRAKYHLREASLVFRHCRAPLAWARTIALKEEWF